MKMRAMKLRRTFVVVTILTGTMTLSYLMLATSWQPNFPMSLAELCKIDEDINRISVNRESLLEQLYNIHKELHSETDAANINSQLDDLIKFLEGNDRRQIVKNPPLVSNKMKNLSAALEVCPEIWLGPDDRPFFFNSWEQRKCSNVLPFKNVITVLLHYLPNEHQTTCSTALNNTLAGLRELYPKVTIIVAGVFNSCVLTLSSNVRLVEMNRSSPGQIWNLMINLVKTPYILFGRELDNFMWTSRLERQVRLISYNQHIAVAGGSVRNLTGHWYVGCFQTSLRNYVLKYVEGYYRSVDSCMFCDHLSGPFVAQTNLAKSVPFDESLPSNVVFEDWFLRVRQSSYEIVNCPDVMYLASHQRTAMDTDKHGSWLPIVQKWGLNRIAIPGGQVFSYSCSQANISCLDLIQNSSNSLLMPICCVELLSGALGVFDDFCRNNSISYELADTLVLGIVKMKGMMPWNITHEHRTVGGIHTTLLSNATEHFRNSDIVLNLLKSSNSSSVQHWLNTSEFLLGFKTVKTKTYNSATAHLAPTQAKLNGRWMLVPLNPGKYVRDIFGYEILWHAGYKQTHTDRIKLLMPNEFTACFISSHHSCLDLFSSDGNIQFDVPN